MTRVPETGSANHLSSGERGVTLRGDPRTFDDCSVQADLGAKLWFWHRLIWSHHSCVTVKIQLVLQRRLQTHRKILGVGERIQNGVVCSVLDDWVERM